MNLSLAIARWRVSLKTFPALLRDAFNYIRFRRMIFHRKDILDHGIAQIEWVNPRQALERIHHYRFPDTPWPEQQSLAIELAPDCDGLETMLLGLICRISHPYAIFEIGTYEGRTANVFALHSPPECKIFTLDLPPDFSGPTRFAIERGDRKWLSKEGTALGCRLGKLPYKADNRKIEQLFGDSAAFDYTPYRGRMDLVFVDGAHSYDYVMSDVENALTLLTPRGFILLHDFLTHAGVTLAAIVLRQRHDVIHIAQTSFAVLFPKQP